MIQPKNIITTAFVASTLLFACNKENSFKSKGIIGTWKWLATYTSNPSDPGNPATPENTDSTITLHLASDKTWKSIINNTSDSGTYTTGNGTYLSAEGAVKFSYDSIVFYKNNKKIDWQAFRIIQNDTLVMSKDFAGIVGSGTKYWLKL